jgi:hypothetical protein
MCQSPRGVRCALCAVRGAAGGYCARQLKTWGRNWDAVDPVVQAHMKEPQVRETGLCEHG